MSFINSVKNFIGIETEDDYYEDEYYDEEDEVEEEPPRSKTARRPASKVVPINPGASSRVRIMKPTEFDDSGSITDEIKGGRLVIFNVSDLDPSEARRVVDFVSGAAYGINGNVRRVSGGIFVAAPRNIDITGENLKEQTKNTFNWNV